MSGFDTIHEMDRRLIYSDCNHNIHNAPAPQPGWKFSFLKDLNPLGPEGFFWALEKFSQALTFVVGFFQLLINIKW